MVHDRGVIASLAMSLEGSLVVASAFGLTEVDATGQPSYTLNAGPPPSGNLSLWSWSVIAGDGTRIVADVNGRLYGVRKGVIAWERTLPGSSGSGWGPNLAISSGGLLIAAAPDGELFALR